MCIVDLHDIELLDDFCIDFQLPLLKWWNDLLTQVDRDDIVQDVQTFYFFVSLKQNKSREYYLRSQFWSPWFLHRCPFSKEFSKFSFLG